MTELGTPHGHLQRARAGARALALRVSWADAPFVVALFMVTFPGLVSPNSGLDSSWVTGLAWAQQLHLPFGSSIDFTYGPWSILDASAVFSGWMIGCWLIACAVSGWLLLFVVRAVLIRRLSQLTTSMVALLVVPLLLATSFFSLRVLFIAVALAFLGFATGPSRGFEVLLGVSAALSAVATLDKFSTGILAIGMTGLAALTVRGTVRNRLLSAVLAAAVYLVVVPIAWIAGGQQIGDVSSWLRASIELVSGYADAMAVESPQALIGYPIVALLVVALFVQLARGRQRSAAPLASVLVIVVVIVIGMRTGFTRNDGGHAEQTFALLALTTLLAGVGFVRYRWAVAVATVAALATLSSVGYPLYSLMDPGLAAVKAEQAANAAISSQYRASLTDAAATSLQSQYDLNPAILSAVQGRTVHIDPFQANVAWSYRLKWKPAPIIQSYTAYTPYLDQLNADNLASSDGPQSIIKAPLQAIDSRNPMWESPRYVEAMVCNFDVAVESDRWLLLDRVDNRCSAESQISSQHVQPSETVMVPAAPNVHSMVVARLILDPDPLNTIATAIFKPLRRLEVATDTTSYQLPRGEATGPLVLRMPDSAGWPSAFGGGYAVPALSLNQGATIQFFAVDVQ